MLSLTINSELIILFNANNQLRMKYKKNCAAVLNGDAREQANSIW